MMNARTIAQIKNEAAERARRDRVEPFVYDSPEAVTAQSSFPFPFIGDHEPEGWELIDKHFVDSSGFGADDEPALSYRQFRELLERKVTAYGDLVGFAVVEAGQFQLYVGEFRRDRYAS